MNYNFYSSVHKHRECQLNQQYKGCKSPKGQVKTGPSWTHVSYSKNGEKALQQAIWYYGIARFRTIDLKSHPIAQFEENCIIRKKC